MIDVKPPYYAVIFSNNLSTNTEGYADMADAMRKLAAQQPGYLGFDSARDEAQHGIAVSYWSSLEAIQNWRNNIDHQKAMQQGMSRWYKDYEVKIARVERTYTSGENV